MEIITFHAPAAAELTPTFLPTLIVIALAFSVPILLSQFGNGLGIPVVVGEIFLGILIGQLDINLFSPLGEATLAIDPLLDIFYNIGLGYLFFLAGTEIDANILRGGSHRERSLGERISAPLPLGTLIYSLTLILGLGLCYLLFRSGLLRQNNWAYMALTLAPSSLGIIISVLKERGYNNRHLGQVIFVSATVADFGTVIILAIFLSVLRFGVSARALLILLIFGTFMLLYLLLSNVYNRPPIQRWAAAIHTATSPVKLRFALLIFLIFFVLSQAIDIKVVLGTFLGGVLIKLLAHEEDKEVLHGLESIGYGFFVPMFFITVGIRFDLNALIAEWRSALLLVPLLFVIAIVNKLAPAALLRLALTTKETFAGGMLLTARLSLMVAAAQSGVQEGLFNATENAAIILLAMIVATAGPLIFNRMMPRPAEEEPPPIVVASANIFGLELAAQLERHGEKVVLIDPDPVRVGRARERGFSAFEGHLDRRDDRVTPILDETERFVSAYTDPEQSFAVTEYVKRNYGTPHVVAEVQDPSEFNRFQQMGVVAVNPTVDRTALLVLLTRSPASYYLMTRTDDNQEVHEVIVRRPDMIGQTLRDIHLPIGWLVLAIRRRGELLVPNGSTRLEAGDFITVVGPKGSVNQLYQKFAVNR